MNNYKKYILDILKLLIFIVFVNTQINAQTTIYPLNVGIGINSPTTPIGKLHIKETGNGLTSLYMEGANLFGLRFKSLGTALINTTTHRITQGYNNDEIDRNGFIDFIRGGDNSGGGLGLGANGIERIRVLGNGNVGIGNNSPIAKLDVTRTAGEGNYLRIGSTNNAIMIIDSWGKIDFKRRIQIDGSDGVWAGVSDVMFSLKPPSGQTGNMIEVNSYNGTSGNLFNIRANGNVGIGTTTPNSKLDIRGDRVTISGLSAATGGISVFYGLFGSTANEILGSYGSSLRMNNFEIRTLSAGLLTGVVKASVDNSGNAFFGGNMGIGTVTPNTNLEILGPVVPNSTNLADQMHIAKFQYKAPDGNSFGLTMKSLKDASMNDWAHNGVRLSSSVASASYGMDHLFNNLAWVDFYGDGYTNGLRFGTNNIERLRIKTNGNIGIGNSNPLQKLSLVGLGGTNVDFSMTGRMEINSTSPGIWFRNQSSLPVALIGTDPLNIANHAWGIYLPNAVGWKAFCIANSGNIGINTLNPTEKLAVDGNILSRKVRVTQTGWPDYVFEEKYPLMSLPALYHFIIANKHLPDVPTEQEITANGLDLGDMNALLLKKVEELTLYVIDLQNQINTLKKESNK